MVGLGRRSHLEDWFRFKSSEWSRGVPPAGQSFEKKTSLYFWVSFTEFPDWYRAPLLSEIGLVPCSFTIRNLGQVPCSFTIRNWYRDWYPIWAGTVNLRQGDGTQSHPPSV